MYPIPSGLGEVWDFWEFSILTCFYNEDKCKQQDDKNKVSVFNSFGGKNHYDECNRKKEENFEQGVAVFKMICPYIEDQSSPCFEDCAYCGNDSNSTSKAYAFYNYFFLTDDGKTTGDFDIEHEPNADVVGNCFVLIVAMIPSSLSFSAVQPSQLVL